MMTLPILRQSKKDLAGFTLLELMLVLVIIGITGSLIVGKLSFNKNRLNEQVRYLQQTVSSIQQQAIQYDILHGLSFNQTGWQLMTYVQQPGTSKNSWQIADKPYVLPNDLTLSLTLAQQDIPLSSPQIERGKIPQLWFFPEADITTFQICLRQQSCKRCLSQKEFMAFTVEDLTCEK